MQTIERVTFRLVSGADREAFLRAAQGTDTAVRRQAGFQGRMLTEAPDGTWTDIVTWESLSAAEAAAQAVMAEPEFPPFAALIDMESVTMSHATLVWRAA